MGGIGNFGGEIERVLGFGGVEGCGAVGGCELARWNGGEGVGGVCQSVGRWLGVCEY